MDFDAFTQKMKKGHEPAEVNLQNDSLVYLFKVMYDDIPANEINMSRFSLEDVSNALDLIDNSHTFDEDEGIAEFYIAELDTAVSLSNLEYRLSRHFLDVKTLPNKRKVTFI